MSSSIVICEKGSQAAAIQRAVGAKYGRILPAQGHILTLKEPDDVRAEWSTWTAGLLWPGRFYDKKPVSATRAKLDAIRSAASTASRIIIATDCDREGQLIGDEIVDFIGFKGEVLRCIFNAEDPKSLQEAFAKLRPNSEFRGLYMSGQAREQADQTTNLSLTRTATVSLRSEGMRGAIGIGRVKSPVLGIICKRELEIENFKPQDMFEVDALTRVAAGSMTLTCAKLPKSLVREQAAEADDAEDEEELSEDQAALEEQESTAGKILKREIAEGLRAAVIGYKGELRQKSEKKRQGPPKLFDLTALQAAASSKFGWTGERTLDVAQKLYSERTLITYPRGEAKYLPENNISDIPKLVPALLRLQGYGQHRGLLQAPQVRKGKAGHFSDKALEGMSHYAIIPNVNTAESFGEVVPRLSDDEARLFDVIVKQYLAALAPDFEYRQTTVDMLFPWKGHTWEFRTSGRVPLVPGWRAILGGAGARDAGDEQDLPVVEKGEAGAVETAALRTVTTRPPARYTEGGLMKIMQEAWRLVPPGEQRQRLKEAKGIGTPATRGDVPKGLLQQGQIEMLGKSFKPTEGGMTLYKALLEACPNVVDPARTAMWEMIFDLVEKGRISAEDAVMKILAETSREIERIVKASSTVTIAIGKAGKPTPKMVALAERILSEKGIKAPPKLKTDSAVCRAFLDAHLPKRDPNAPAGQGVSGVPSDKQLDLARRLASEGGLELPAKALASSRDLSAWIDAAMKKQPPRPPSDKQLDFARKLATENKCDLPEEAMSNAKVCSAFIDMHMNGSKGQGRARSRVRA